MKNVLIISTTEEELLSNVDDGTNRLFINGSEIPSTDWMGTGNYTATVEGHAITIAKIDVESLDGLNVSLAKTADYTYEMRRRVPTTIVVDDELSTSSINPVQNKVITNALNGKVAKTDIDNALSTTSENPVQNKVITNALDNKVAKSGDTMTGGLRVNSGGLYVKGRVYASGDDEGIVVDYASNNWAGVMLGGSVGRHAAFYLRNNNSEAPFFRYRDADDNTYDITHPAKSGTIALTSDIPQQCVYYLGELKTAGKTIEAYYKDFANAHKNEYDIIGCFNITATNTPSDIPANSTEWIYSFGYFRIRNINNIGESNGVIELYGWNTGRLARRSVSNNTVSSTWVIDGVIKGKWVPKIYDLNTDTGVTLGEQEYFKMDKLYILPIYHTMPTVSIGTMLQIRNHPCDWIVGGQLYIANMTGQGGDRTVQASNQIYFRPNITGNFGGGIFSALLFGYDN